MLLAHNMRCQMCLSQTAALLQWLRSERDSFHAVHHHSAELESIEFLSQAKVRQRYSDNKVCSLYLYAPPSFLSAFFSSALECSSHDLFQLEDSPNLCRSPSRLGPLLVRLLSLKLPVERWSAHPDSSSFFSIVIQWHFAPWY